MPFWEMLKTGSDVFLASERPPMVAVCDQRYVFNMLTGNLDPNGACPAGIETASIAGVRQSSRSASAGAAPLNRGSVAYRVDDPIAQKINDTLRGVY
ncbi:MAG: hypothetical protein WAK55_31545, partial [Xanthobacteraceae bacterium]